MTELYIARRPNRRGLILPMGKSLIFPLDGVGKSELDELIRAILAKQGVTNEAEIQKIIAKAEEDSEVRTKVYEARKELRRLMAIRAKGISLISAGFRKWREAFYPATKQFKG